MNVRFASCCGLHLQQFDSFAHFHDRYNYNYMWRLLGYRLRRKALSVGPSSTCDTCHYISRGVEPGERGSWICTCSSVPSLSPSVSRPVLGTSSVTGRTGREPALSVSVSASALVSMLAPR